MSEIIEFKGKELELIKTQLFPKNASDGDISYCLGVASQLGLNPITKEIFFLEQKSKTDNNTYVSKVTPMVSRDGFLSIAHKSKLLDNLQTTSEIREAPRLINGKWQKIQDLVATCKVKRKDCAEPFVVEVSFNEYAQTKSNGDLISLWRTKPDTMLKKVAESQALRKAFNISGVYSVEEMGAGNFENGNLELIKDDKALAKKLFAYLSKTLSTEQIKEFTALNGIKSDNPSTYENLLENAEQLDLRVRLFLESKKEAQEQETQEIQEAELIGADL